MLIADPVKDFYERLKGNRVLLLIALDVDALASCKILQSLFQCDLVQYTLVAVTNQLDVKRAFEQYKEQYENFVFINCGGNIDLLSLLQPPDHTTIYVIDSHRPVDLVNFYCEKQVYLLMRHDSVELSAIPDYDELYRDHDSDSDGSDSDDELQTSKRTRFDEETLQKRRQRRLWKERRREVIFDYEEFSYHGESSALLIYELAWKLSKDSVETLWWGVLGVTDQFQNKKIGRDKYFSNVIALQRHVSRIQHRDEDEESLSTIKCMRISFEYDLDLVLYRHWSLFESLCHSPLTATAFKVWTANGLKKLHQFIAEMGIPLVQCKQNYSFMDLKVRENLLTVFEESSPKFGLADVRLQSFLAQTGYIHKFAASDVVYSVNALLSSVKQRDVIDDIFLTAMDALTKLNSNSLSQGISVAKSQMVALKNMVSTLIDAGEVLNYGPFLYLLIGASESDNVVLGSPIFLNYFARHLLDAYYKSLTKFRKERAKNLPLIVSTPFQSNKDDCILIGVPPVVEESRKNLFGRAFLFAAKRTNADTSHDFFDPDIITLKLCDRSKFLDALINIMS